MEVKHKYIPRAAAAAFHARNKRFSVIVAHRRWGKTVMVVHDMVVRALRTQKRNAFYAYLAPYFGQAKQAAWTYLKDAIREIPGARVMESETTALLPNGSKIRIFGADNADAFRGLYFDGIVLDEFGDMAGRVWTEVIRPALADRQGWAVFIGTPRGKNKFFEMRERAKENKTGTWFYLEIKASESGVLPQSELDASKEEMDEDEYQQEYECSFDASIKGAYYGPQFQEIAKRGGLCVFDHVAAAPVHLAFDLGYSDSTVAWFFQVVNGRLDVVDHYEVNGLSIQEIAGEIEARAATEGYKLGNWWLPHDAEHKSIQTGKTVIDQLVAHGIPRQNLRKVPDEKVYQGIQAVRKTLPHMRIHSTKCYGGVEALKSYSKKWNAKSQTFSREPNHDWASHSADAMRYLCLVVRDDEIERTAPREEVAVTAEAAKYVWESTRQVNTTPRATYEFCLDDIWDTAHQGGFTTRI